MGKRRQLSSTSSKSKVLKSKHQQSGKNARPTGITKQAPQTKKKHHQPSQSKPIIPFQKTDKILLIGEADLSFTCSLLTTHSLTNLVPTVLESSAEELVSKYPKAEGNIKVICGEIGEGSVKFGVDVMRRNGLKSVGRGYDRVVFNFPHVGGKSTDVNRQVRYNQQLLVSFFTSTLPLLSPTPGSSILVTLFEGEPYTLWNIRDLGRHCGLEVKRSWGFQWGVWKGYAHARTLGVVRSKSGGEGGWRGEERGARTFEFVRRGEGGVVGGGKGGKRGDSDDEDKEDMDVGGDIGDEVEIGDENGDISQDDSATSTAEESWEGIESDSTPDESNKDDDDD